MMLTSLSCTAGDEPLPDDVACAHGTGVAAMTQLMYLRMHDLSLPVLKSLPERTELLEKLTVWHPGVNWVSGNVVLSMFTQCCTIGIYL